MITTNKNHIWRILEMKKFKVAELVVLNLQDTAFGPDDETFVDVEKHTVTDNDGNILGFEEEYGQKPSSQL